MIWLRHPAPGLHPLVELQMRMIMMKSRSEVSVTDPFLQLLRNWTLTGAQLWTTRNSIWNHFQKLLHSFNIIMAEYKQTFNTHFFDWKHHNGLMWTYPELIQKYDQKTNYKYIYIFLWLIFIRHRVIERQAFF